jgi:CRP/FNR family cyclic AMP-dependent transcriptional regulator
MWRQSRKFVTAVTAGAAESGYSINMITHRPTADSCLDCPPGSGRQLCDLPDGLLATFDKLKAISTCPRGQVLFTEGQRARGVFVLCQGRVRLSISSGEGRRITFHIAGPGETLGLSAVLSGQAHELRAEALDNCRVALVQRKDLLHFLRENRAACERILQVLADDLELAYQRVRQFGLARTRRGTAVSVH